MGWPTALLAVSLILYFLTVAWALCEARSAFGRLFFDEPWRRRLAYATLVLWPLGLPACLIGLSFVRLWACIGRRPRLSRGRRRW